MFPADASLSSTPGWSGGGNVSVATSLPRSPVSPHIDLRVTFDGVRVAGAVTDEGKRAARRLRSRQAERASAMGLLLVGQIADSWGVHDASSEVWFEIADRPQMH